jgi:hypothetical protein
MALSIGPSRWSSARTSPGRRSPVRAFTHLPLAALLLVLAACAQYRTYPLLTLQPPGHGALQPTGIAVLQDGRVVTIAEGDARALLVPTPDTFDPHGSALDVFPLTDGRDTCDRPGCKARSYRAGVRLRAEPITWMPRERRLTTPYNVEDLAPFGPDRVLGVTEYTTIGRRTGWQRDYVARSRRQTERLFVLEQHGEAWQEVAVPEIDRLRGLLSDWGRASCDGDMLVEGLAWDPGDERVYIGLRRCGGPVMRVLGWNLGSARRGLAADLEVVADGIDGATAGPEEGVSGLCFAAGRLWALSAWDSYGYEVEPAFGGRLHEVRGGRFHPVDLSTSFLDRPSALAVLPGNGDGAGALDAVVLFDNDEAAAGRPNATVLQARIPRPQGERFSELVGFGREEDPLPLGLNGFDFRWWVRDHRLSNLAAVLARKPGLDGQPGDPGGWTRALGGLWQIRVGGSLGLLSRWLPGAQVGHNKQAIAFTDYSAAPELHFTRYQARVSVVPHDREARDLSVADLLVDGRDAYRVTVPLPAAAPGAGLVLQGFEIDTSSRADKGICLAAMDLGVDWHSAAQDAVDVQATLLGGICNDFDARGPDYRHGLTTAVDGGVLVTLHFAVVDGAPAVPWSLAVYDKAVPAPHEGDAPHTPHAMDDTASRTHLHCVHVGTDGAVIAQPRTPQAPPAAWLSQGTALTGVPVPGPGSLRGFALALDPAGFDPGAEARALTDEEALGRNNYIYRYLVRAFPDATGAFVEGGITHGIHLQGPIRDNARPSALALRVDMTSFPTLAGGEAAAHDITWPRRREDPNLLPEDGYLRWSASHPADPMPTCSPSW